MDRPSAPLELLAAAASPVYLIDSHWRLTLVNQALADWVEAPVEQLVGRRLAYHSEPLQDGAPNCLADLCPPPGAWLGEETRCVVEVQRADRRVRRRRFRFLTLLTSQNEPLGLLAWGEPRDLSPGEPTEPAGGSWSDELHRQVRQFRRERAAALALDPLIGSSTAARQAAALVQIALRSGCDLLVLGPPGSGQQRVACAVHYADRKNDAVLWRFDCVGLPLGELEHLLAKASPPCTLLAANIDHLGAESQQLLARTLDRQQGGVRLLATMDTHGPVGSGAPEQLPLDPSLAAKLSLRVCLPALAERLEDLPALAQLFVERENAAQPEGGKQLAGFDSAALQRLTSYAWPGDVAQLAVVVATAYATAKGPWITASDLPPTFRHSQVAAATRPAPPEPVDLDSLLRSVERELIDRAIEQAGGNRSEAARLLGMTRARLYRRIESFEADPASEGDP